MIKIKPNYTDENGMPTGCFLCNADSEKCQKMEIKSFNYNGYVITLCDNCMLDLIANCAMSLKK